MNLLEDNGMPVGLGMALAENTKAMSRFAALTNGEKMDVMRRARDAESKDEMREIVRSLVD